MISPLKTFQLHHGAAWGELVGTPAFAAALAMAHEEQIQKIRDLSDDEIATKGAVLLADLRGHLKYEQALLGLHERKEFVFQQLGSEEYPDPEEEAREEAEIARKIGDEVNENMRQQSMFAGGPTAHDEIFPKPRPKKKKLPPKRKPRKIRK